MVHDRTTGLSACVGALQELQAPKMLSILLLVSALALNTHTELSLMLLILNARGVSHLVFHFDILLMITVSQGTAHQWLIFKFLLDLIVRLEWKDDLSCLQSEVFLPNMISGLAHYDARILIQCSSQSLFLALSIAKIPYFEVSE